MKLKEHIQNQTKIKKVIYGILIILVKRGKISIPALPEKLAEDHIISWSKKGRSNKIHFMGSGTTQRWRLKMNRFYRV